MKTIQQDLKSSDLNMDDAVDLAQNRPLWRLILMSTFGATHSSGACQKWMDGWMDYKFCSLDRCFPPGLWFPFPAAEHHCSFWPVPYYTEAKQFGFILVVLVFFV